ncbi:probable LRR receptor-like serine/threonine-protein kinase At1g07560 [Camellia sinensis]|uniref:probable LRR receptor-like serine/threonine-protein kinase At1g07560 n=1 Tax=Camellia sinensis TaxID=4442 RepID=UPI00103666F7|nr:probable LRR receptor-like serine/threonine-protein kinase At1g07560 [Camellia sinensis]
MLKIASFDSQTKETLTIRQRSFGSKCELSQEFLKKVSKSGIVESLLSWADFKIYVQMQAAKRSQTPLPSQEINITAQCLVFTNNKNRAVLTWEQRLQIAIDASHALEYLHDGCKPPIIHRDIKTANILVNENLQAKVVDFGLSRNFPDEDGDHVSTAVVGTLGYLDPEQVSSQYHSTSRLTKKSDVYSFGVVLLELITGKPAIIKNDENIHVVNWVKPMLERGEISNIVDPRLQGEFDINSAWKAFETAMACIPTSFNQRPNMSGVVGELKDYLKIYVGSGKTLDTTEINKLTSSQRNLESSMICPQAR